MKIYHVTHKRNLPSILKMGLDPQRAKNTRKAVWGVVKTRVAWALVHVLSKPWNANASLSDLVVIEIELPKAKVRRYKPTIWFTTPDVGCVAVTEKMILNPADFGHC